MKFIASVFLMTGIGLFVFVLLFGYIELTLKWYSDPMLFLGIGITMFICFILQKKYKLFDYLDSKQ